jgi:hypothetical protein
MDKAGVLEDMEARNLALRTNRIHGTVARVAGARASVTEGGNTNCN